MKNYNLNNRMSYKDIIYSITFPSVKYKMYDIKKILRTKLFCINLDMITLMVILISECVTNSHDSLSFHCIKNFKIIFDYTLR